MKFSDPTQKDGLIQHAEQTLWGDNPFGTITDDSEKFAIFRNLMNRAMDKYTSIALGNDFRWNYDDANHPDYPVGLGRLVKGQQDYPLPLSYLYIEQVELRTKEGNWVRLTPFDLDETRQYRRGISETKEGTPRFYRKLGQSLLLYPTPDYSDMGDTDTGPRSLRVHYKRPSTYFSENEPDKVVGISPLHAPYIYLSACADYADDKGLESATRLREKMMVFEQRDIPLFFGRRAQDRPKALRPRLNRAR